MDKNRDWNVKMLIDKGLLNDMPTMKLLLAIFEHGMTGVLYLKNEDVLKVLYFSGGKMIWASSNSDEDTLENILISRELVSADLLVKVKEKTPVSESIGKVLVEKGLITFEGLIDSYKTQIKRIVISVLKWKNGGYQFVKNAPPERLPSLDLNIMHLIVDFILNHMEDTEIWETIGSLQMGFIKNPDEQKVARYNLPTKQAELLNNFNGKDTLESILSRYSGGHRNSLLKIIYFFVVSELLLKKEFELPDIPLFDDEADLEHLKPAEVISPDTGSGAYTPPDTQPAQEQIPEMDSGDYAPPEGQPARDQIPEMENHEESYDLASPREEEKSIREPAEPVVQEPFESEKRTRKIKMVTLILVTFVLVLSGIILLLLHLVFTEDPTEKMAKTAGSNTEGIVTAAKQEPKTETKKETPGKGKVQTPGKTEEKKKEEKSKPKLVSGKSALAYFLEGNISAAGNVWKREIKKTGARYSILLELDCLRKSVIKAFEQFKSKEDFFVLNRPSKGRTCFLVMYGKYRTRSEAMKGLKAIPQFFWQQQHPPEVIEVTIYLK